MNNSRKRVSIFNNNIFSKPSGIFTNVPLHIELNKEPNIIFDHSLNDSH